MGLPEVRVVSLSTLAVDLTWLNSIPPPPLWKLESLASVQSTVAEFAAGDVAVVLCDCDGDPHAWRILLEECQRIKHPPHLIVTSRLADERLWAEALNLGAYDVLAKPFNLREVLHSVNRALLHWSMSAPMPLKTALRNHSGTAAA